ncbi:MAG: BadF/BadG/BcrA/BcrD ATPase family protein, partial [archaeon]
MIFTLGIDIGSTTLKAVVVDEAGKIVFKDYQRHFSMVREKTNELLHIIKPIIGDNFVHIAVTGSAGLGVAKAYDLPFVQEVFATAKAVDEFIPNTDVVVELGGEDAKILFFKGTLEERMNGSCAGGTGAFIDQMAVLLGVTPKELDDLSKQSEKIYSIASRCGVFAKSDIQPLLNQGAKKEDIAASIFQCVVDQTTSGLAAGRKLEGKIAFLGGPLFFFEGLRNRFVETLKNSLEEAIFPEDALYFVAKGAAIYAGGVAVQSFEDILTRIDQNKHIKDFARTLSPLFEDEKAFDDFKNRHSQSTVKTLDINDYKG